MAAAGITSPSWSNEDADDFWDDDLSALDEEDVPAPVCTISALEGPKSILAGEKTETHAITGEKEDPILDLDTQCLLLFQRNLAEDASILEPVGVDEASEGSSSTDLEPESRGNNSANGTSLDAAVTWSALDSRDALDPVSAPETQELFTEKSGLTSETLEETPEPADTVDETAFQQAEKAMEHIDKALDQGYGVSDDPLGPNNYPDLPQSKSPSAQEYVAEAVSVNLGPLLSPEDPVSPEVHEMAIPEGQEVETTEDQEVETIEQEVDATEDQDVEITEDQEVETTEDQEVETTENQEVETTENQEVETPEDQELEATENQEANNMAESFIEDQEIEAPEGQESNNTGTSGINAAEIQEAHATDIPGTPVSVSQPPVADPHHNTQLAQLAKQIEALKAELGEKDARLLQWELSRAAVPAASPDSFLAEKVVQLEERLQHTEQERDHAQSQLEGFLSKISSMKTVFQNFKATQKELDDVKLELNQQREAREQAEETTDALKSQVLGLEAQLQAQADQQQVWDTQGKNQLEVIERLRAEAQDLNAECDRLSQILGTLRRESQKKEDLLQDEKYALENEVGRLNKKLSEQKAMHNELDLAKEDAVMENKNLLLALEESQERLAERENDLRTLQGSVQDSSRVLEARISELERQLQAKDGDLAGAQAQIESISAEMAQVKLASEQSARETAALQKDLEKIKQLEEDVHSKQLIIGKLRHEAIILNEHLTKSLLMLKQKLGDSDHTVDRELVSNMVLNFVQIPRGDTKKFEALSLLAGLLDWDDQKKIQAGLMHSGRADESKQRLGLISLWTDFLDKESSKK